MNTHCIYCTTKLLTTLTLPLDPHFSTHQLLFTTSSRCKKYLNHANPNPTYVSDGFPTSAINSEEPGSEYIFVAIKFGKINGFSLHNCFYSALCLLQNYSPCLWSEA